MSAIRTFVKGAVHARGRFLQTKIDTMLADGFVEAPTAPIPPAFRPFTTTTWNEGTGQWDVADLPRPTPPVVTRATGADASIPALRDRFNELLDVLVAKGVIS